MIGRSRMLAILAWKRLFISVLLALSFITAIATLPAVSAHAGDGGVPVATGT